MKTIDLNADVGEGLATDAELIPLVTSANIACGGHAGDDDTMSACALLAIHSGVAIGAHPGHEDREHFGRRELTITPSEITDLLDRQVSRLYAVVQKLSGELRYLKLHGALYHHVSRDAALAAAVVDFANHFPTPLSLLGQSFTELDTAATAGDVPYYSEAFADRLYLPNGSLAPRNMPGAVIQSVPAVISQVLDLVHLGEPRVIEGFAAFTDCDSICLHGDGPNAVPLARAVRVALEAEGITLRAFTS